MIPRYSRPEMVAIWSPETKFRIWYEIEAHACDAQAQLGVIPKQAAKTVWEKGNKPYDGARIDRIAAASGMSKPMIYSYFGDKDDLYAAALREAYVQIREGERTLNLSNLAPSDAIRALVEFTLDHFIEKPLSLIHI